MQAGDILLIRGSNGPVEALIRAQTHGPYAHCAVAVTATEIIEAVTSGVHRVPVYGAAGRDYTLVTTGPQLAQAPQRLAYALGWLDTQLRQQYGFGDVLANRARAVLPNGPFLIWPNRPDCSHLVTQFLLLAGYPLPYSCANCPQAVAPNDLARALQVLA